MKYIDNPVTEKDRIINALLSFDETEFDKVMEEIHRKWYNDGWDDRAKRQEQIANTPLPVNF
jgi:hypothetical protein